jgi:hypothetical protein
MAILAAFRSHYGALAASSLLADPAGFRPGPSRHSLRADAHPLVLMTESAGRCTKKVVCAASRLRGIPLDSLGETGVAS